MSNTHKLDRVTNELVPFAIWQERNAQRERMAAFANGTFDADIQVIEPSQIAILPSVQQSAIAHTVKENTDPEKQAKGFLLAYGLGIVPLYALLSAGIVWVASGTFLAGWFLLIMGLMSSITWLWAQKHNLNHSGAGIRRHEVTQQAKLMSQSAEHSYELAKMKMAQDHQYRREALRAKMQAMKGA